MLRPCKDVQRSAAIGQKVVWKEQLGVQVEFLAGTSGDFFWIGFDSDGLPKYVTLATAYKLPTMQHVQMSKVHRSKLPIKADTCSRVLANVKETGADRNKQEQKE